MQPTTLIRSLYDDVLSAHRLDRLAELVSPEVRGVMEGPLTALIAAVPDIQFTLTDVLADGDRVCVRWTWSGTHRAPFRGHAATDKALTNTGLAIYTVRGAQIASVVIETDRLGFLEQVGAAGRALAPEHAAIYLVDTFTVPAAARPEFEEATRRTRTFIRTLPGFRGDLMVVRGGAEVVEFATVAAWDTQESFARAKQAVGDHYRRIGFDPQGGPCRLGRDARPDRRPTRVSLGAGESRLDIVTGSSHTDHQSWESKIARLVS